MGVDDAQRDPMREVELLQEVIARHEKHAFTVKALLATALTGLAALVFSLNKRLEPHEIVVVGAITIVAFGIWALTHSALVGTAVRRVTTVEASIRDPAAHPYDGPKIAESLAKTGLAAFWEAGKYRTNFVPFLIASLVVGAIAWGEHRFRRDETGREAAGSGDAARAATGTVPQDASARAAQLDIARFVGERLATIESASLEGDRLVVRATLGASRCEVVSQRRRGATGPAWSVEQHRCEAAPVPVPVAPSGAVARSGARSGGR